MSSPADALVLPDAEFRLFQELLKDHAGLHFPDESRFLLEKRIARRLRDLGLPSFTAYHYLLRRDKTGDQELANLIDELTTNETYFFREGAQLRALMEEIIPQRLEERKRRGGPLVSIWSAGCSSGEEPYSIVMLAKEAGLTPGTDLRVYASDISRSMLQKARRGVYRPASFRDTPDELKGRYFTEADGHWRISDEVKRHVVFTRVNLMDRARIALLGTMDVILCRNVIIYFDHETKRRVIESFAEKLRPGGHLLLGHSESLINLSNAFELCHLENDLVYRRPEASDAQAGPWRSRVDALKRGTGTGGQG